jgi:hypothetical protein
MNSADGDAGESAPDTLSVTGVMVWEQCVKRCGDALQRLAQQHRDMHSGISKCGKEIDKVVDIFAFVGALMQTLVYRHSSPTIAV